MRKKKKTSIPKKNIKKTKIDEILSDKNKSDNEINEFIEKVVKKEDKKEKPAVEITSDYFKSDTSLQIFLKEISSISLLTLEDEIRLSKIIRTCSKKLKNIEKKNKLSIEEIKKIKRKKGIKQLREEIEKLEKDNNIARKTLIEANLRLVISIAKKYQYRGLPLLDLINEGNLGLLKAVEMYDYKKGFRFSTYATYWIRQSIVRSLADQGRSFRIPIHLIDQLNKFSRAKQELSQKLGRAPIPDEIAEELEAPIEKITLWSNMMYDSTSLETPIYDSNIQLADFIADNTSISPYMVVEQDMVKEFVHSRLLSILKGKEKDIIKMRYGLDGNKPMTLEDIGKKLGITRERVRQLEHQAISRMRFYRSKKELQLYLQK